MTQPSQNVDFQRQAEKLSIAAVDLLSTFKRDIHITKHKIGLDVATNADNASEALIIKNLAQIYPDHHILSEEIGESGPSNSPFCWIIDPLDNTRSFVKHAPDYSVNLALEYKSKLIIGVVNMPEINYLYSVSQGNGLLLNSERVTVNNEKQLEKAMVVVRLPDRRTITESFNKYMDFFQTLVFKSYRVLADSWDIRALCNIATGVHEGFVFPTDWGATGWWDVAPGILMVEEAGGTVTNFLGEPIKNRDLSKGLIASNGRIHNQLLEIVSNYIDN